MISFDDFEKLLSNESERSEMFLLLKEVRPEYQLGQTLNGK